MRGPGKWIMLLIYPTRAGAVNVPLDEVEAGLPGNWRLPIEIGPGCYVVTEGNEVRLVVDRPIANGSWVSVTARKAWETRTEQLRFPRDKRVLTRTAQEQEDLINQEFGFRYAPQRMS